MSQTHELFMNRAFHLAKMGGKRVAPNPHVGAVLVYDNRIIGEGYHEYFGGPHAEVNCIQSVKQVDFKLIRESTLYVTLEPCCFHGKTPACTSLIIESKIPKVVVSCFDPNERVAGKGLELLKSHGIEVVSDVLQSKGKELIRPFMSYLEKMPYIILKIVKSIDGYIGSNSKQMWLSNAFSKKLSHKWRSEVHGIMVGKNTILVDNPLLTNRLWSGENPIRIIWDRNLTLADNSAVFDDSAQTVILNELKDEIKGNLHYINVNKKSLKDICHLLFEFGIYTLMVEGGSATIGQFSQLGLWDEARIITANKRLLNHLTEELIPAVDISGKVVECFKLENDLIDIIFKE